MIAAILARFAFVLGAFVVGAHANVSPSAQDGPQLTPEQMYARSVRAMRDAPQPAFVTFRENVTGHNFTAKCTSNDIAISPHHGDFNASYDVSYRSSDGSALSVPLAAGSSKACPAALLDPLGRGAVSSLGLPRALPSSGTAPTTTSADSIFGPRTIGGVKAASSRYYRIEFVGREQLDGSDVYHLKLRAFRNPNFHPLTDLYVDADTFLVRESRGEAVGQYVVASARASGIVDFDRVGPYWLVKHESFVIAGNALLVHLQMRITIDGSNVRTPESLPGVEFRTPESVPPNPMPSSTRQAAGPDLRVPLDGDLLE